MAEHLDISQGDKREKYETLLPQIKSVIEGETDMIARMANVSSMLHHTFGFLWTGFYRVLDNQLVLGPFQGPLACTRINKGKGVCGTCWQEAKTQVVANVDLFPGHIACSSSSRSEIVVPLMENGMVTAVLDIDSAELNTFDATDKEYLEALASIMHT